MEDYIDYGSGEIQMEYRLSLDDELNNEWGCMDISRIDLLKCSYCGDELPSPHLLGKRLASVCSEGCGIAYPHTEESEYRREIILGNLFKVNDLSYLDIPKTI